jgi:hypothetical protein
MKNRTFSYALLMGLMAALPAGFAVATMPTTSTGVTGGGNSGGHTSGPDVSTPSSGVPVAPSGTAAPNNGTILDNAKPNDLPLNDKAIHPRTATDNPSAKIEFGKKKKKTSHPDDGTATGAVDKTAK